jgi:hypothetical protein
MRSSIFLHLAAVTLPAFGILAHPQLSERELQEYKEKQARGIDVLGQCLSSPQMKEHNKRLADERDSTLRHIHKTRGIPASSSKPHRPLLFYYSHTDNYV